MVDGIALEAASRVWGLSLLGALGVDVFRARRAGEPVSTATTRGGPVVGIWTMATTPEH